MSEHYSKIQKVLHWVIATFLLYWLLISGESVEGAAEGGKELSLAIHSGGAIIILALTIYRFWLRKSNEVMPLQALKAWEKIWSLRLHVCLYILVFIMVSSGVLQGMYYEQAVNLFGVLPITVGYNETLFSIFHGIHGTSATLFKLLILLHILAALKHQFIDKTPFIKRML